jgi:glycosyltransferase involved in cell wall biosynthesis
MRILILNQYGPPDASPTARLAGDLAEHLKQAGYHVVFACHTSGYRDKYRGGLRLLTEATAWLSLLVKAWWAGPVDRIVVFSSPPLILLAGILVGKWRRAPVLHWALDAYPDVAAALGAGGPMWVVTALKQRVHACYQQCQQVVAVSDAMHEMLKQRYQCESSVIPPWPSGDGAAALSIQTLPGKNFWPQVPPDYGVWCYSGNLGKAHEWAVLLDIQQELEKRSAPLALVIQGGGEGWVQAQQESRNRGVTHIYFEGYADTDELVARLQSATVRVATLKKSVSGLLWPSKWALIECLPGPHLWIGPATDLGNRAGDEVQQFDVEQYREIADWLALQDRHRPALGVTEFKESVDRKRRAGLTKWQQLIEAPLGSGC